MIVLKLRGAHSSRHGTPEGGDNKFPLIVDKSWFYLCDLWSDICCPEFKFKYSQNGTKKSNYGLSTTIVLAAVTNKGQPMGQ